MSKGTCTPGGGGCKQKLLPDFEYQLMCTPPSSFDQKAGCTRERPSQRLLVSFSGPSSRASDFGQLYEDF